jgi:phosphoserine aminotransferase
MNKIYFTVGPTELHPEVKNFWREGINKKLFSISHRSSEFEEIYKNTCKELRKLLKIPDEYNIFFLGSATECMERIIQNLVEKKSFHFLNGYFAGRFYNISKQLKKRPDFVKAKYNDGFNFEKTRIPEKTELLCFTQNETSTGMTIGMDGIYSMKEKNPEKLVAVDVVSSAPIVKIDFRKIDCAFFSVQKCFGMPPGLGVLIVNDKCIEKARELMNKKYNIGGYYNFITLEENAKKHQTAVTPNIPGIYILGKIAELMNNYGIDKIREEIKEKAEIIYKFFENHKFVRPYINNVNNRSETTMAFEVLINSKVIVESLKERGYVISKGYRDLQDSQIRIANFPIHKVDDVQKLLRAFYYI